MCVCVCACVRVCACVCVCLANKSCKCKLLISSTQRDTGVGALAHARTGTANTKGVELNEENDSVYFIPCFISLSSFLLHFMCGSFVLLRIPRSHTYTRTHAHVCVYVFKVVLALGDYMNVQCHASIGGQSIGEDIRKLEYGQVIAMKYLG